MAFEDNIFTYIKKRESLANAIKEASLHMGDYVNELNLFMRKVEEARAISDFFISNPNFSLFSLLSNEASAELKEKVKALEEKEQSKVKALEEFYETIENEIKSTSFNGYKVVDNIEDYYPMILAAFCRYQKLQEDQINIWESSYNSLYISEKLGSDLIKFLERDFTGMDKLVVSDEISYHANITTNEVISGILASLSDKDKLVPIDDSPRGFITKKIEESKSKLKNSFESVRKTVIEKYEKHLKEMKSPERKQKALEVNLSLAGNVNSVSIPIGF